MHRLIQSSYGRGCRAVMRTACIVSLPIIGWAAQGVALAQADAVPAAIDPPGDAVLIASGAFVMGSDKVDAENLATEFGATKPWYLDEHPQHRETLPAFYIDRYEVSNAQYLAYAKAQNVDVPPYWMKNGYLLALARGQISRESAERLRRLVVDVFKMDIDASTMDKAQLEALIQLRLRYLDNVPVVSVSWYEAEGYCRWRGARLPTEREWERVARGSDGREFPWGDEWRAGMSHTGEDPEYDDVAPVDAFASDITPEGVRDLAGNVSEWVADWYAAYPGSDYESKDFGSSFKVVRGSSWSDGAVHYNLKLFQRGAYRFYLPPDGRYEDVGFRCATDVKEGQSS